MRNKNAFTLIELLAVIVILAIIALIAVPIILNVVEDSKKGSLRSSAYGIIDAAELYRIKNESTINSDLLLDLPSDMINYKGKKFLGKVMISKEGKTAILIKDSNHCAVKQLQEAEVKVYDKDSTECKLENVVATTPDECFDFDKETGTITGFKCYEGNDENFPVIRNVIIPDKIAGEDVKNIGYGSFNWMTIGENQLDSVIIPNTVETIEAESFRASGLKIVKLGSNVKEIQDHAFSYNNIERLVLPDSVNSIVSFALYFNPIKYLEISENVNGFFNWMIDFTDVEIRIHGICDRFQEFQPIEGNYNIICD